MSVPGIVRVEAPARLHIGLLDLRGDLGRRFGGAGMAVRQPSLVLEATPARELTAAGPEAERVLAYARRYLEHHGLRAGARLRVLQAMPAHAGLGSGTQLALATARALAALTGTPHDPISLAEAVGRARRSAVGTWAFGYGGFILEGGRTHREAPAPLLLHHSLPESWRCVVAVPAAARGLNGEAEERAFRELEPPSAEMVGEISRLVLMLLLPSLLEGDLEGFGRAVSEINWRVGETFRAIQGAPYAHPVCAELIRIMCASGAAGAGQSSWGPAVFGLVDGDAAANRLVQRLQLHIGAGKLFASAFDNTGARCTSSAFRAIQPTPVD